VGQGLRSYISRDALEMSPQLLRLRPGAVLDEISDQRAPKSLAHGLDSGRATYRDIPLTVRELEGLSVVQMTVDGRHHYPRAFATRETILEVLEVVTPLRIVLKVLRVGSDGLLDQREGKTVRHAPDGNDSDPSHPSSREDEMNADEGLWVNRSAATGAPATKGAPDRTLDARP
jgi:hypothetical protein